MASKKRAVLLLNKRNPVLKIPADPLPGWCNIKIAGPFESKISNYGKPGVDKLRLYDLRNTAAINSARAAKNMKVIVQYWKHLNLRPSARSAHHNDEDVKKGAESFVHVPKISQRQKTIVTPCAPVAQWIEQWIPNPCAAGPIPAGGTI